MLCLQRGPKLPGQMSRASDSGAQTGSMHLLQAAAQDRSPSWRHTVTHWPCQSISEAQLPQTQVSRVVTPGVPQMDMCCTNE